MKHILLIFILIGPSPAWALNADAGTAGSTFLKLGVGARALGLAGTVSAISGDASSLFYNPACSAEFNEPAIFTSASTWIEKTQYGSVAYVQPIKKTVSRSINKPRKKRSKKTKKRAFNLSSGKNRGSKSHEVIKTDRLFVVGIGMLHFDSGSMDKTEKDQFDLVIPTGEQIDASDQVLLVNIAQARGRYSVGLNLKYIRQALGSYKATAYAADTGIIYHAVRDWHGISWDTALLYQNFGEKLDFRKETPHKDKLPSVLRFGNICTKDKMRIGLDLSLPVDNDICGTVGFEYQVAKGSLFRAGIKAFGYDKLGDDYFMSEMRFGLGIPITILKGMFDYAYVPMGDFGSSHHISITVFLIKPKKKEDGWFDEDLQLDE